MSRNIFWSISNGPVAACRMAIDALATAAGKPCQGGCLEGCVDGNASHHNTVASAAVSQPFRARNLCCIIVPQLRRLDCERVASRGGSRGSQGRRVRTL
jgi:hypothetical protein